MGLPYEKPVKAPKHVVYLHDGRAAHGLLAIDGYAREERKVPVALSEDRFVGIGSYHGKRADHVLIFFAPLLVARHQEVSRVH